MDPDAGLRVGLVLDLLARGDRSPDAVLGREQGDELQVLVPRDQIDDRRSRTVDRRLVGDETDTLSAQRRRHVGEKHLDAGPNRGLGDARLRGHDGERATDEEDSVHGVPESYPHGGVDDIAPFFSSGSRSRSDDALRVAGGRAPARRGRRGAGAKAVQLFAGLGGVLGLQLYSLRTQMEKDVPGTLKLVRDWGLSEVETAGYYGRTAAAFAEELKRANLTAKSMHAGYDMLRDNLKQAVADAKALGATYVTTAWITHTPPFTSRMPNGPRRISPSGDAP